MQVMQGSDLAWLLVIVAVAAFLAGRFGERLRAESGTSSMAEGALGKSDLQGALETR